tara:strand:+ start:900 stop:1100 length:201 start_codon:yes stop_codon:yes gene_type:complete
VRKKRKTSSEFSEWVGEFTDMAESAVVGYEKYLMNEINYRELSRIMVKLREYVMEYRGKEKGDSDE